MQTKSEMINRIAELAKENAELKAENEKLWKDYKKLMQQKDLDNARWQKVCTDLHVEDKAKADKYWLVLQEIKEIAEIEIDCKQYEIDHDCFNDTRCKALRELIETLQDILAIITKTESEG